MNTTTSEAQHERVLAAEMEYLGDWCDIVAMKGAREILKGVRYPDDATRRSLYASWLRVFASNNWHDSFDGLMLDCVAATPSVSTPGMPLFADIYKAHDPVIDGPYGNVPTGVLNLNKMPSILARRAEPIEPLPTCPGVIDYLADLIRHSSREALDAAGQIISLCSMALALVVAKPLKDVQDLLLTHMETVLPTAVLKNCDGEELFWPSGRLLCDLCGKADSPHGVVKPYLVLLVLGQYAYYVKSENVALRDDVMFIEKGFLNLAKFGNLEVIELLYEVEDMTGLQAAALNQILREQVRAESVAESSIHVAEFLKGSEEPMQMIRPWCRTADDHFFSKLDLSENLDYAMRLTALLAQDFNDELWDRPEFSDVTESRIEDVLLWASHFKDFLFTRKYELSRSVMSDAKG